jgi:hypothetical protein
MVRAGCALLVVVAACDSGPEPPSLDLPPAPAAAPGGREIVRAIETLDVAAREERIHDEVARGNVPAWLRDLQPVDVTGEVDGRERHVTFWAAPDYLAVGSDDDFFFIPLSPAMAVRIADRLGASLPTAGMVDAVWAAARRRLVPIRIQPDEDIGSVRYFERHNNLVLAQRRRIRPGTFVAGHKLDVVRVVESGAGPGAASGAGPGAASGAEPGAASGAEPGDQAVALYGWHQSNGTPIQPFFPVPLDTRPHFSMGVRLVHRRVLVDGVERDLEDVLADPGLARLLGGTAPGVSAFRDTST